MSRKRSSVATVGARVGNVLLTLASIGGVVCVILVILAAGFHITLIMFKTGSMSPGIPAGSLAVVREIPASEVKVGDVTTIARPGALPITHRVTSVTAAADITGEVRVITMKGDANPTADPLPYTVSTVRLLIFSVPALAYVIVWFANPLVLGAITLAATVLVSWAFWPRKGESGSRSRKPRAAAAPASRSGQPASASAPSAAATPVSAVPASASARSVSMKRYERPRHQRRAGRGMHATLGLLIVAVAVGSTALVQAAPAQAAMTERVVKGSVLRLTTIGDNRAMAHMTPGVPVNWQIGVSALPRATGSVDMTLSVHGALADDTQGLHLMIRECSVRWVDDACSGDEDPILGPGPACVMLAAPRPLAPRPPSDERWLMVTAWIPTAVTVLPVGSASFRVTATGSGDFLAVDTDGGAGGTDNGTDNGSGLPIGVGSLPSTGVDPWMPLVGAIAAPLFGLSLAWFAAARRRRRETDSHEPGWREPEFVAVSP